MQSHQVRLAAVAMAIVCAAPGATTAAPRRTGKVVRVPRPTLPMTSPVRTCAVTGDGKALCQRPIEVGEVGALLDDTRNLGSAIVRAAAAQVDACGTPVLWTIDVELTAGGADPPNRGVLVLDHPVDERAMTLNAPAAPLRPGEQVIELIDADGDGQGDLRLSRYACDRQGVLEQTIRPTHQCTDTWLLRAGRWRRVRADRVGVCPR